MTNQKAERLQKILAHSGITSRRKAEELIREGSVTINGKVAGLGDKAIYGKDAIKVHGKLLNTANHQAPIYMAFYKPKGVISALVDPQGRPTLADYLGKVKARLFPVGRLDFMLEGLILLTNDGDFADKLQKRDDIPRVFSVKVKGHPAPELITRLQKGAALGEKTKRMVKPYAVRQTQSLQNKTVLEVVVLGSGLFDLKTLFAVKGFLVDKISRTAIGQITLKGLLPGQYRFLKASQAQALLDLPHLELISKTQAKAKVKPQIKAKPAFKPSLKPRSRVELEPRKKNTRSPRPALKVRPRRERNSF